MSSIRCRDHGKEVWHRITEVKVSNALSLSSEGLWRFCTWVYLSTDVSELGGDFSIFQFHVHGVAQQSQAASGPQHPVSLREELLPLKPMRRCHGRHQIHLTWPKRELFCRTLSGGSINQSNHSTVNSVHQFASATTCMTHLKGCFWSEPFPAERGWRRSQQPWWSTAPRVSYPGLNRSPHPPQAGTVLWSIRNSFTQIL